MGEVTLRRIRPESAEQHRAETERLFAFMVRFFDEASMAVRAPNPGKAMQVVYDGIRDGIVLVAEMDGAIVGTIGLTLGRVWYADDAILNERWFFILPAHRDGFALALILGEVRRLCVEHDAVASIVITNPNRRRVPHTRLQRVAEALCFQSRGAAYAMDPAGDLA